MNFRYLSAKLELDQMASYLELVQSSISHRFEELEAAYKLEAEENLPEFEAQMLEDHYIDQFIETNQISN